MTEQETVTYRAVGRDFTGPKETLEAYELARAYAQGYMDGRGGEIREVKIFLVGKGCLPIEAGVARWPSSDEVVVVRRKP